MQYSNKTHGQTSLHNQSEYLEKLKAFINKSFPGTVEGRVFTQKLNIFLEEQQGFTPFNTRFAEGMSPDELNEHEVKIMVNYWGSRYKYGGLAGYCHGGKTGMGDVFQHVPQSQNGPPNAQQNIILFGGPHIGLNFEIDPKFNKARGVWGEIVRCGQGQPTAACGSLVAALDQNELRMYDFLDMEQCRIESMLKPWIQNNPVQQNEQKSKGQRVIKATKWMNVQTAKDLTQAVQKTLKNTERTVCICSGVTINTTIGNYIWFDKKYPPKIISNWKGKGKPLKVQDINFFL